MKIAKKTTKKTKLKFTTIVCFEPWMKEKERWCKIKERKRGAINFYTMHGWEIVEVEIIKQRDEAEITCYMLHS